MGNIEFIGILDENFSFGEIQVPNNAKSLKIDIDNMNPLNQLIFCLPIVLCLLIPMIIKQRKYGLFNKEIRNKIKKENIEKYKLDTKGKIIRFGIREYFKTFFLLMTIFVLSVPIHELFHAIPGALLGANMKIGVIPEMLVAFAITSSKLTKIQYLILLLTPVVILGIIPAIIILLNYPKKIKNARFAWISLFICLGLILSTGPDIISTYNIIKNVPNGAILQQTDDDMYWYTIDNNND